VLLFEGLPCLFLHMVASVNVAIVESKGCSCNFIEPHLPLQYLCVVGDLLISGARLFLSAHCYYLGHVN
jgi:hypothetical protein